MHLHQQLPRLKTRLSLHPSFTIAITQWALPDLFPDAVLNVTSHVFSVDLHKQAEVFDGVALLLIHGKMTAVRWLCKNPVPFVNKVVLQVFSRQ